MKISIQERVIFFVAVGIALFAAVGLLFSMTIVHSEYREHEMVVSVMGEIMNLDAISHELLFAQKERGAVQWEKAYERTERHLEIVHGVSATQTHIQLQRELREMLPLFRQFMRAHEHINAKEYASQQDVEMFIVGQMRTRLATVVKIVQVWHQKSAARVQTTFVVVSVFTFVLALFSVVVLLVWPALLRRRVFRPLLQLKDALGEMAAGNFSRRLSLSGNGELDEVATTFNALAERLENKKL